MNYDYDEYLESLINSIRQEKTIEISNASFSDERSGGSFEVVGGSITSALRTERDDALDAAKKIEFAFSNVTNKTLESMASDIGGVLGFYPRESYANIVKALANTGAISRDAIDGINLDNPSLEVDDFINLIQSGILTLRSLKNDNSFSSLNKGRHDLYIKNRKTKFDEEKSGKALEKTIKKDYKKEKLEKSIDKEKDDDLEKAINKDYKNEKLKKSLDKEKDDDLEKAINKDYKNEKLKKSLDEKKDDDLEKAVNKDYKNEKLEKSLDEKKDDDLKNKLNKGYEENDLSTSLTEEKSDRELEENLSKESGRVSQSFEKSENRGIGITDSSNLGNQLEENLNKEDLSTSLTEEKSDRELEENLSKESGRVSQSFEKSENRGIGITDSGNLGNQLEENLSKEDLSWKFLDEKNRGYDREESSIPLKKNIIEDYFDNNLEKELEKKSRVLEVKELNTNDLEQVFKSERFNTKNIYEEPRNSEELKTTGYIYVMPVNSNILSSGATAFKIPLQNNLIFQDDNIKSEYNTINFLNRVGSVVQYVRVESRTMDVETSYFVETSNQQNKMAYFTMEKLQRIESMYKSLMYPQKIRSNTDEKSMLLSRPPIINILIGGDTNNSIELEKETDERNKKIQVFKRGGAVINNLFTSPTWKVKENGIPENSGDIYYRSFVVSDLSIKKDQDKTPYYMEKDMNSNLYRPKDFAGFSVRMSLLEIDPNYIGVNPTFEDFVNFGSNGVWGPPTQELITPTTVTNAQAVSLATSIGGGISPAFIRGTPL